MMNIQLFRKKLSREIIDLIPSFETNFNVGFFSDTIKARFFKLFVNITLFGVYVVVVGLVTLTLFQGYTDV